MISKKQKNTLPIILMTVMVLFLFGCQKNVEQKIPEVKNDINFLTYTNIDAKFSLEYPSEWNKDDTTEGVVLFLIPGEMKSIPQNKFSASWISLEEYPMILSDFKSQTIETYGVISSGWKELDSKETTLSNSPAFIINGEDETTKYMILITIKGNYAYTFTYMADKSDFNSNLDKVNKIIPSISLE